MTPLTRFAELDSKRKAIFRKAWEEWVKLLESEELNKQLYAELREQATDEYLGLGGKSIITEYGELIVESTPYFIHENSHLAGQRQKIKLITKEY